MSNSSPPLLKASNLQLNIPGRVLLDKFDWQIQTGEMWALIGRNGSGKTSLLHCLAGLRKADCGFIELEQQQQLLKLELLSRKQIALHLALLQQHTSHSFEATVLQMALAGRHPHLGLWQRESAHDYEVTRAALKAMDLEALEQRNISSLSGGENRRLAFATMLAQQARLLLLDEPSNHLDIGHQVQIMEKLRELVLFQQHGALIAIHDLNLAARYCSHVLMLFGDGRYLAGRLDEVLSSERLSQLYQHPIEQLIWDQGRYFLPG